VTALLAGEIDMLLVDIPVVVSHIQSGASRRLELQVSSGVKSFRMCQPSIEAGVAGVISEGWYAMYAPVTTPAGIISFVTNMPSPTSWLSPPLFKL